MIIACVSRKDPFTMGWLGELCALAKVKRVTDGTGEWLWTILLKIELKIIHLRGPPGSGKTHLAKTLVERIPFKIEGSHVLSWDVQALSDDQRSSPSSLPACLLHQLLSSHADRFDHDAIISTLSDLAERHPQGPWRCPFPDLWNLLLEVLEVMKQEIPGYRVFLVVDGLDKCQFHFPRSEFRQLLNKLQELSANKAVSVVVLSCATAELSAFTKCAVSVDIHRGVNEADILHYASSFLLDSNIHEKYRDIIMDQVKRRNGGNFLWTKLYLENLDVIQTGRLELFVERIHKSPPEIGKLFDQIMCDWLTRLTLNEKALTTRLYRYLCVAPGPLPLELLAQWLEIQHLDLSKVIPRIGGPLCELRDGMVVLVHLSVKEWLIDNSRLPSLSGPDSVFVDTRQGHADLTKLCLEVLLDPQYGSIWRVAPLLRHNIGKNVLTEVEPVSLQVIIEETRSVTYDYASSHWVFHLTRALDPDDELLTLLRNFLQESQFAHWTEYTLYKKHDDFTLIRIAYVQLKEWLGKLPGDKRPGIELKDFYAYPYHQLSKAYSDRASEDRALQYMAKLSLIRFFNDLGAMERASELLVEIVQGLTKDFGTRHPLTMRARRDRAALYVNRGMYRQAYDDLVELVRIQEEELGLDSLELYRNIMNRGVLEYLMNRYFDSISSHEKASRGFLRLCGPDHAEYIKSQVSFTMPLIAIGDLESGLKILSSILERRRKKYGKDDIYGSRVQYSIGDIYRQQGQETDSLECLRQSLAFRRTVWPLGVKWSLDVAISLLIALRDFGKQKEALDLLQEIDNEFKFDPSSTKDPTLFSRFCQVTHLRALLQKDAGRRDAAIMLLKTLLIRADRDQYNRAVLWIMLDLAALLRERGKPGDLREAEVIFNNILRDLRCGSAAPAWVGRPVGDSPPVQQPGQDQDPEPDPVRLLRLAEKALILHRNRDFEQVEKLFREEKVEWFRPQDLWITFGAPAADTGCMKPP
ncbi:hypothetical protein V8F06_013675 [Rhypophila decipiens]